MYEIKILIPISNVEKYIELLNMNNIINVYYEQPFEVTTERYGYGYIEREDGKVHLKIYEESDNKEECEKLLKAVEDILNIDEESEIEISHIDNFGWQQSFNSIDLGNGWTIAPKEEEVKYGKKINFESQGAFGTGIHETTQDCLRVILEENFHGKSVMDLGTGSGLLSIAAALKGADRILAVDIRDVNEEIAYNSNLNNINNIDVLVGNILDDNININKIFDYIFINIGGEETLQMFKYINRFLKFGGKLLVSGLVTWSYEEVLSVLESEGYSVDKKLISNEWVTMLCNKE